MCSQEEIEKLLDVLLGQPILAQRGFTFRIEKGEELLAFRGSHLRGIWRCESGEFAWTPAGYAVATHTVRDVGSAVRYTLVALATSS